LLFAREGVYAIIAGANIGPAFPAYRPSLAKKYLMIFKRFDELCGL